MAQNIQGQQAEFMVAGQQQLGRLRQIVNAKGNTNDQAILYMNLCEEEFGELEDAFKIFLAAVRPDEKMAALSELLDAVCDLAVVMMGLCNSLGLPFEPAFNEVHRSNMAKFVMQEDGSFKILKRADGKIIKPHDWTKPNIIDILKYKMINEM
jgi:predicted HAD superfamily Cof-like phosphohydrolase